MDGVFLWGAAALIAGAALPPLSARAADTLATELTPTGKLRVAIAISPAPGPFWSGKDATTGAPRGVAVDLARHLAEKLSTPLDLVIYDNSGAITEAAASGAWDVTFVPMDAERMKKLDFGPVYNIGESTFLARAGSGIETLADVDRPGVRVLGVADTTTIRAIGAWLKNAKVAGAPTIESIVDQLRDGRADAFGMSREALTELSGQLPGARVLPGHFFQAKTAIAVPRGRPLAHAYVEAFIQEAKASGLLRRVFDDNGLKDLPVAP